VQHSKPNSPTTTPTEARDWVRVLAQYREPSTRRSLFELSVTLGPFVTLWALAWWSLSISGWLALAISLCNAAFLLRLFAIQHDCGHSAFFKNREVSDWVGRAIGVLTLTPYDVWRHAHSVHHNGSGNLNRRGMGDINTLTVAEYQSRSIFGRFLYRLYRNPIVLFGLGPGYIFFLTNRLPQLALCDAPRAAMAQCQHWHSSRASSVCAHPLLPPARSAARPA